MASTDYSSLQIDATELITEFGNGRKAELNYVNVPNAGKKEKVACVVVLSSKQSRDGAVNGANQVAYVSGKLKFAPQPNDYVVLNKKTYSILAVNDLTPDGKTTCFYELTVAS